MKQVLLEWRGPVLLATGCFAYLVYKTCEFKTETAALAVETLRAAEAEQERYMSVLSSPEKRNHAGIVDRLRLYARLRNEQLEGQREYIIDYLAQPWYLRACKPVPTCWLGHAIIVAQEETDRQLPQVWAPKENRD
jgi:hypothetical protein